MTDFIDKSSRLGSAPGASVTHTQLGLGDGLEVGPLVVILMCTFNGGRFLAEQLDSLESQIHRNWSLIVSDDGSEDSTLEILLNYQAKWPRGKMTIRQGPQKGFCQNFLSLACDPQIQANYFAFCDQDDVWLPSKLEVALENIIANQEPEVSYLYCGRTKYVDENLNTCGISPLFVFPPSFRNALVQSIAGGNTMVFNLATKQLVEKVGLVNVASHDWWLYLLVSGAGGHVFYDPVPNILYRQHEGALIGGNNSVLAKLKRIQMIFKNRFQDWNTLNIIALNKANYLLVKNHRELLRLFEVMRFARFKDRFRLIEICGLYRQTRRGTLSLFFAALIRKI